ncbi:hypothetical protein N7537_001002 [Penicillium hordei]|uniref:Uncharacterized protein n=1 Tax=Penicillium hordei TaxID=40994 RepID=A0AAD6EEP5_9EURO|nr:uncharacterized protein N7537_001002 [Penicillium hordei]KAJ5615888.1 hypothetical protein N7537_001002 [Penicillium hordei]
MADSERPLTICTYCRLPGHDLANCHVLPGLPVMNRVPVTHPIEKKKARRGSRGGRAKRAKKAKEAKKAKGGMSCHLVEQNHIHPNLETAPGTSASGTGPDFTFIGEVITEEEAAFLALCLRQFRAPQ